MIAKSAVSMQHYLDTVNGHSVKWKYNFNTEKIKILIFGKVNKNLCFTINGKTLLIVDGYKHLGVSLCSSSDTQLKLIEVLVSGARVTIDVVDCVTNQRTRPSP